MTPTADDFRALARSSPWRWTTLHLRHRGNGPTELHGAHVEAWLARPDGLRLVGPDGQPIRPSTPGQGPRPTGPWRPPEPAYRPDGLVAERPAGVEDDGLFWQDYRWLAMLDPAELSHDVAVDELRAEEVHGRPVWWASVRALPGYDPRCSCCPLVWCEVADRYEYGDDPAWVPPTERYPDHYDVALDVPTGVVVRCLPVGGTDAPWSENDILESG